MELGRNLVMVGIGGLLGSVARYLVGQFIAKLFPLNFPYGTFLVNVVGCLAIGIFYGIAEKQSWFSNEWRLFLIVGLCGGFTTFSSFAWENLSFLQNSNYTGFFLYTFGSFISGLLAVWTGLIITK